MKYGTWNTATYTAPQVDALQQAGYSPLTARVLCSRGITTPGDAARFLACDAPLCDPFLLREMDAAAARILQALEQDEKIAVYGDYAQPLGAVFQKPPEGVLQGCALALVYLMVEKNNLRVGSGGVSKVVQILRLAAVVYQNDVGEAVFQQAVNDGIQLFIRIQRGQNHGNIG